MIGRRKRTSEELFEDLLKEVAQTPAITVRADPTLIGQTIGHFMIESHIGSGGMGAVYLATDMALHRKVAVKILPREVAENPVRRALLLREARSAAAVSHLNIAAIHEVGEHSGLPYIVMELVQGATLRRLIADGALPQRLVFGYAAQIARGLARAHKAGIIHRDLKPDNIIVDSDDVVKILDFGLARSLDPKVPPVDPVTSAERRVTPSEFSWSSLSMISGVSGLSAGGTPAYMAPEQAAGLAADARADVFSFGATVFEMLTGHPGKPNQKLPWRVPRHFARVVERCLSESPARRYADGEALEEALRGPSRAPSRAAVAAAALLAMSAAGGALYRSRPSPRVEPRQVTFHSSEKPVLAASLSPDGRSLAFIDPSGVSVQDVAGQGTRALALSPKVSSFWGSIDWFPDRKRIVFGGTDAESKRSDLWIVDVATGETTAMGLRPPPRARPAAPRPPSGEPGREAAEKPEGGGDDGDGILYGSVSPDGKQLAVLHRTGTWGGALEVVDLATRASKVLYETQTEELVAMPRWSPDGRRVAFMHGAKTPDFVAHVLEVVDVASGKRLAFPRDDRLAQDNGNVAFNWSRRGGIFLALAPSMYTPDNASVVRIAEEYLRVENPTTHPAAMPPIPGTTGLKIQDISIDARGRIALVAAKTQTDVMVGELTKAGLENVRALTASADTSERPSVWSSDSRAVLTIFDSGRDYRVHSLSPASIGVFGADQGAEIPGISGSTTWPVPGPGGRGILYWRIPEVPPSALLDESRIVKLDLMWVGGGRSAAESATPVYTTSEVHLPGHGRPPPRRWTVRCAATGSRCFVAHPATDGGANGEEQMQLEELDVERRSRSDAGRFPGWWNDGFALSPDGSRIAVCTPDSNRIAVFQLPSDGRPISTLAPTTASFLSTVTWIPDGSGSLLAVGSASDAPHGAIFRVDADGRSEKLWHIDTGNIMNVTVSPDGRGVAFAVMPYDGNVWLLDP